MLAWVDIETTGLDLNDDELLEVGLAATTNNLTLLRKMSWVVHCPRIEQGMPLDDVVREMHTKNGLLLDVVNPAMPTIHYVEAQLVEMMQQLFVEPPPMCGSSVHFDRAFLKKHMPAFEQKFHYRNIDVSTVKELVNRWHRHPTELRRPKQLKLHRVDPDLTDTMNEAFFYKELLFS